MVKMSRKDKEKWKRISGSALSLDFIKENKNYLDFKLVSKESNLTQKFIEDELIDYIDWSAVVLYQKFVFNSPEFIWNNSTKINWDRVSGSPDLTIEHLRLFPNYLNWNKVIAKHKYDEETLLEFSKFVDWKQACISQELSMNFLEDNKILLFPYKYEIYKYQKLDLEYIERHKDDIDWDIISDSQNLPEHFIDKYSDYVNWTWISKKQKLSKKFLLDHKDKINWVAMIKNKKYIPKEIKNTNYYFACNVYINNPLRVNLE